MLSGLGLIRGCNGPSGYLTVSQFYACPEPDGISVRSDFSGL
jgi:hypothetical protein